MQRSRLESIGISVPRTGFFRWGSIRHAVKAGRECLRGSHYHQADLEVLINAGVYRDGHYVEPAIACFIQKKLGINIEFKGRQTLSFDLLNGGCGMLNAAHVLTTMLKSGFIQAGMVISSDANRDRHQDPNYKYPASGAAFVLDISPLYNQGFGEFVFRTFEEHLELYRSVVSLAKKNGHIYVRKNSELEDAFLSCAELVFEELLELEKLKKDDIDLIIPSQVSREFIEKLAIKLGFQKSLIVDTTHLYAYTLTTSVFLSLQHTIRLNMVSNGKKVVFLTFGSGITVGAAIYYF